MFFLHEISIYISCNLLFLKNKPSKLDIYSLFVEDWKISGFGTHTRGKIRNDKDSSTQTVRVGLGLIEQGLFGFEHS